MHGGFCLACWLYQPISPFITVPSRTDALGQLTSAGHRPATAVVTEGGVSDIGSKTSLPPAVRSSSARASPHNTHILRSHVSKNGVRPHVNANVVDRLSGIMNTEEDAAKLNFSARSSLPYSSAMPLRSVASASQVHGKTTLHNIPFLKFLYVCCSIIRAHIRVLFDDSRAYTCVVRWCAHIRVVYV